MKSLHYLTVQDVLWINLQATGRTHRFQYAALEEAVFYQYAYGDSHELPEQAARFATGFRKLRPLSAGNEVTGFVALIAFVRLNGRDLRLADEEAAFWYEALGEDPLARIRERMNRVESHGHGTHGHVREIIRDVLADYPQAIASLGRETAAV